MPATKYGQQRKNRKKLPPLGCALKGVEKYKKYFFENARNFSVLDERDCQSAWLFAYWCPFVRQRQAWPDEADSPHFHMHIGKNGQFFEVWVSPGTNSGFGIAGPHNTTGFLQNTPGTPAIHFPLAVAALNPPCTFFSRPMPQLHC